MIVLKMLIGIFLFLIGEYYLYLYSLQKRANNAITNYSNNSSVIHKDLKIWFKNFDIFEKKKYFNLSLYDTTYDYYNCDLILNEESFLVVGKINILGKQKLLMPTIFEFNYKNHNYKKRCVVIDSIEKRNSDLEIKFIDPNYKNKITLVIKRISTDLNEKILEKYTKNTK